MKKKFSYISLFSGCGGFDTGYITADFNCLGAFEIDPVIAKVYKKNIGDHIHLHDLNSIELPMADKQQIDLVLSGSPCQGFSTIGKRKLTDPRNELLIQGGKIAVKYRAKLFVAENVLGSLSGEHKKYWDKLITFLQSHGYHTELVKYNAVDYGVPQIRKRVILYAWHSKKQISVQFHNPVSTRITLRDVLTSVKGNNHHPILIDHTTPDFLIAKNIRAGQKLSNVRGGDRSVHTWDIPSVFGDVTEMEKQVLNYVMIQRRRIRRRQFGDADPLEIKVLQNEFGKTVKQTIKDLLKKEYLREVSPGLVDLKDTFNGKFRRLSLDGPSITVDSKFCDYKYFIHPEINRGFTVREAARVQSFDDDFIFEGPVKKQVEMIGNAVPPKLAKHIASVSKQILQQL